MQDKKDWNFIFEGIGENFELFWKSKKKDYSKEEQKTAKERKWKCITDWIDKYTKLIYSIPPKKHIRCLIETKQQYKDFDGKDILHILKTLGELGHLLYLANRDIFEGVYGNKQLEKYYVYALEQVTWLVASFVNLQKDYCNFISLVENLEEKLS